MNFEIINLFVSTKLTGFVGLNGDYEVNAQSNRVAKRPALVESFELIQSVPSFYSRSLCKDHIFVFLNPKPWTFIDREDETVEVIPIISETIEC